MLKQKRKMEMINIKYKSYLLLKKFNHNYISKLLHNLISGLVIYTIEKSEGSTFMAKINMKSMLPFKLKYNRFIYFP